MGLIDTLFGHAGETDRTDVATELAPMLAPDETVLRAFAFVRDVIVFTDRRIVLVNRQGPTGRKTEYRSIPYRSIAMHSLETAGHFELDAVLWLWLSGQPEPIELTLGNGKASSQLVALLAEHSPR